MASSMILFPASRKIMPWGDVMRRDVVVCVGGLVEGSGRRFAPRACDRSM
jgi:hypothetical protein